MLTSIECWRLTSSLVLLTTLVIKQNVLATNDGDPNFRPLSDYLDPVIAKYLDAEVARKEIRWLAYKMQGPAYDTPDKVHEYLVELRENFRNIESPEAFARLNNELEDFSGRQPRLIRVLDELLPMAEQVQTPNCGTKSIIGLLDSIEIYEGYSRLKRKIKFDQYFFNPSLAPKNNVNFYKFIEHFGKQHLRRCWSKFKQEFPSFVESLQWYRAFNSYFESLDVIGEFKKLWGQEEQQQQHQQHPSSSRHEDRLLIGLRKLNSVEQGSPSLLKSLVKRPASLDLDLACPRVVQDLEPIVTYYNIAVASIPRELESEDSEASDEFLRLNEYYRLCQEFVRRPNIRVRSSM